MDQSQKEETIIIHETREWYWDCPACDTFNLSGRNGWDGPYDGNDLNSVATCYKCKKDFEVEEVEY